MESKNKKLEHRECRTRDGGAQGTASRDSEHDYVEYVVYDEGNDDNYVENCFPPPFPKPLAAGECGGTLDTRIERVFKQWCGFFKPNWDTD